MAASTEAPGGAVVHCLFGSGRTGIAAAVLLVVAGVPATVNADDFVMICERADVAPTGAGAVVPDLLALLANAYGGAEGYRSRAGVSSEQLKRLRARLLATPG